MIHLLAKRIVEHPFFTPVIIGFILLSAIVLGLETSPSLHANYGHWFELSHQLILAIFIIEALLKITAVAPHFNRYFGDGWNLFDFSIILLALVPATGELAMIARLARLLRVLRLVSALPELRLIVTTLIRSIPSMGHIIILMSIIFYIYGITGFHLFSDHDPQHWGSLGISLLTLFRVVTLEDWTDVMYIAMELSEWAWIYFVSFVIIGTFVVINLFIAVVLNNLEQAKAERLDELRKPASKEELIKIITETQATLKKLQQRMEQAE